MSEALPNISVCNFSGDDKNCSPAHSQHGVGQLFPASIAEPPVMRCEPPRRLNRLHGTPARALCDTR